MDDQLTALEEKISRVVALCEGLRAENASLQSELVAARKERDAFGQKLDQARGRLEALVKKLPAE